MNKSTLRDMIREEVQNELYAILPGLLKEALTNTLKKQVGRVKPSMVQEVQETPSKPFDPTKLASLLGYGDMNPDARRSVPTPSVRTVPKTVAGIPVSGGLLAHETRMGMAHLRDMPSSKELAAEGMMVAAGDGIVDEVIDDNVGAGDAPPVPVELVMALGQRAKAVLAEAERKATWRPGMKRPK